MASRTEVNTNRNRFNVIKDRLPTNYGVLAKLISPTVNIKSLHQCANGRSTRGDLVTILEKVVELSEKNIPKNTTEVV
jgi:hypothetical protein